MNYFSRVGMDFKTVGLSNKRNTHGKTNQEITRIIFASIEEVTTITYDEIIGVKRNINIRQARQIVHYFLKQYTNYTLEDIGKQTKNNHSTVIHSIKVVPLDMSDRIYRLMIEQIEELIKRNINN